MVQNQHFLLVTTGLFCLSMFAAACGQDSEPRTWKSKVGGKSLLASLESYDKKSKTVTLKDESGELVEVKMALLSLADRRFVTKEAKKDNRVFQPVAAVDAGESNAVDKQPQPLARQNERPTAARRERLYGIDWTTGLDQALLAADRANQKRPVMWFRVLGDLRGLM